MSHRTHLTYSSVSILQALAEGCRYGFDVMDRTGLPSGTVYPALRRLEKQELVRSEWEENDVAHAAKRPRRRYYEITVSGVEALEAALKRFRMLQASRSPKGTLGPSIA